MADFQLSFAMNSDAYPTRLEADAGIKVLVGRFRSLPRHIAAKHLGAAMRRVLKRGVPILRANTPPIGTRRGRRRKGEKPRSSGDLRRAVTIRTGQSGRNNDFDMFVWGVLGYRAGFQSRKAIWLQYGTATGINPVRMIERTMTQMGPIAAADLAREMAAAFEKASNEVAGNKNPVRSY